jgi:hypothetical protein
MNKTIKRKLLKYFKPNSRLKSLDGKLPAGSREYKTYSAVTFKYIVEYVLSNVYKEVDVAYALVNLRKDNKVHMFECYHVDNLVFRGSKSHDNEASRNSNYRFIVGIDPYDPYIHDKNVFNLKELYDIKLKSLAEMPKPKKNYSFFKSSP